MSSAGKMGTLLFTLAVAGAIAYAPSAAHGQATEAQQKTRPSSRGPILDKGVERQMIDLNDVKANVFGSLAVKVTDNGNSPVDDAGVIVKKTTSQTFIEGRTDRNGVMLFTRLPAGKYELIVTDIAGKKLKHQLADVAADSEQNITLKVNR